MNEPSSYRGPASPLSMGTYDDPPMVQGAVRHAALVKKKWWQVVIAYVVISCMQFALGFWPTGILFVVMTVFWMYVLRLMHRAAQKRVDEMRADYAPGGPLATLNGCVCPTLDNNFGHGHVRDAESPITYLKHCDCKVHSA